MPLDCKVTKEKTDDKLVFTITVSNANPLVVTDEELNFWHAIEDLKTRVNQFRVLNGELKSKNSAADVMANQLGCLQGSLARTFDSRIRHRIDIKLTEMIRPICTEAMNWWVDAQDKTVRCFLQETMPYREEYKYAWDDEDD